MLRITIQLDIEEDDYNEFLSNNGGDLNEWIFGEICQNQGLGFLTDLKVRTVKE